jgi:Tfp pilus assembly protein PilV
VSRLSRRSGAPRRPRAGGVRSAAAGFSLIEVLFAIAFLGFGLLAVAQMIPLATRQVTSSKVITDAVASGQTKMEELKMLDYADADLAAGSHTDTIGRFTRTWVVTDDVPSSGTKRVDLAVTWENAQGTQEATMTTHIMR